MRVCVCNILFSLVWWELSYCSTELWLDAAILGTGFLGSPPPRIASPGGQANVRLHGPQCLHSPHCPRLQWPCWLAAPGSSSQPSYHPSSSHVSTQVPAAGCGSRELTHFSDSLPRREKWLPAAALHRVTFRCKYDCNDVMPCFGSRRSNVTATSDCVLFMTFKWGWGK